MRSLNLIQEEANRKLSIPHCDDRSRCHWAWTEGDRDKEAWLEAAERGLSRHDFDQHLSYSEGCPCSGASQTLGKPGTTDW